MSDPAVAAWDEVLATLETRLDRLTAAFDAGEDPELDEFVPPDLPPIPDTQVERTRALLERTEALERRMSASRDELGRSLVSLQRRRGPEESSPARYVDRAC